MLCVSRPGSSEYANHHLEIDWEVTDWTELMWWSLCLATRSSFSPEAWSPLSFAFHSLTGTWGAPARTSCAFVRWSHTAFEEDNGPLIWSLNQRRWDEGRWRELEVVSWTEVERWIPPGSLFSIPCLWQAASCFLNSNFCVPWQW